ncbi:efflux RND transporter periplasmic adaptor subunit [Derxia gummosa]|uniref:Efflux RND transporter periplasmic adaptor subunit n=1 Tax=Derxia gummosa DSM 723 TaxID=1121388 RepID=A0A8B6X8L0_9BURK|nr:efflux RND transporter periplasmic adaptor subunit [Derxia gummosa]
MTITSPKPAATGARARRRLVSAGLVLVVLAGLAYARLTPPPAPRLLTAPVVVADIEDAVVATGTLQGLQQVSVGAQVSGQLKSLKVALGDTVKQGDLVAEIDSLPQQNALRTAEAALANVQAQRASKQATLTQARLAFERAQTLAGADAGSREALETAQATLDTTLADIAALDAQIRSAAVAVDTARINLGYTRIVAPIDGTVVAVVTKQGQTVNANQSAPTILILAQLDQVTVKAQISEADVVRVKPGQPVYFTILGEPDVRRRASLRAVEPAPESISSSSSSTSTSSSSSSSSTSSASAVYYNGLFDIPNPDGKLRISMTAEVHVVLGEARGAISIPATALGERQPDGRVEVRVARPDGPPETRLIRTGLDNHVNVQVLEGLQAGEQVVIGEGSATPAAGGSSARRPPPMF